jgi:hypothetical protein
MEDPENPHEAFLGATHRGCNGVLGVGATFRHETSELGFEPGSR